jgi:hypothetical protein
VGVGIDVAILFFHIYNLTDKTNQC